MSAEVMSFDREHDYGIKLLMTIDDTQEISRIPLSEDLLQK